MRKSYSAIFVANRGFALVNSRMLLMKHFVSNGWRVYAAIGIDEFAEKIEEEGIKIIETTFARRVLTPVVDWKAFRSLRGAYSEINPALVHHFNVKPIILGTCAAMGLEATKVINTVTGLGLMFDSGIVNRAIASAALKYIKKRSNMTIFQNQDDHALLLGKELIEPGKCNIIVSSGVDTKRFKPIRKERNKAGKQKVLMVSRLLWHKGIREYIEAAEICRKLIPRVRFQLAGEEDAAHPSAVDLAWIKSQEEKGIIEYLGFIKNLGEILPSISLFVLPSYYGEGVPRVGLEAAACGIPVITTDAPGCRELVADGETGLLVQPRDKEKLATAMMKILPNRDLQNKMGDAGRALAERKFDLKIITNRYLDVYRSLGLEV